jgi:NodT family efflux transporter outer membrane factor (OMF) lipoprotein
LEVEKLIPSDASFSTNSAFQSTSGSWVQSFLAEQNNPLLLPMLNEALQNNQSLRQSAYKLAQAGLNVHIAQSDFWPELNTSFEAGRSASPNNASADSFELSASMTYELDLWGALSDAEKQAKLEYLSARASYEESQLQLIADVLSAYIDVSTAQQRQSLFLERVNASKANLDIIERGYRSGLTESLDVYLARNDLSSDQTSLAEIQQTLRENKHGLERLLGRMPTGAISVSLPLAMPNDEVALGIPSDIMTTKPAIQSQWYSLLAEDAALAIAHKNRFPSVNLRANVGKSSSELSELLSGELAWSLLGGITAPLFNAGRLEALESTQLLEVKSTEQEYIRTVHDAMLSVENALTREGSLLTQYEATEVAAYNAKVAQTLALEQYQSGLVTYTTVLEAQARNINAQNNLITIASQRIINRIQLHVALGGKHRLEVFSPELPEQ